MNRHMFLLFFSVIEQGTQVLLILDGKEREVLLDETEKEGYVEFVEEWLVQFWVVTFEYVEDDKDALLIELK